MSEISRIAKMRQLISTLSRPTAITDNKSPEKFEKINVDYRRITKNNEDFERAWIRK